MAVGQIRRTVWALCAVASAAFKYHVHVIHSPMIKPLHTAMLQPVLDIFRNDSRIDFTPSSYLNNSDDQTSWCQAHGTPAVMGTTFSHRRVWAQIAQCAPDEPCRHPLQLRAEGAVCSSWNASRCAAAPASFNIERCYRLEREHSDARDEAWTRKWTSLRCESVINTNGPWHIILEDDVALPGEISSADVRKRIDEELAASNRLLYYLGSVGGKKKYGLHAYAVRNAAVARWLLFDVVKTSCPSGEWFGNTENPSAEMNKLLRESTVAGDGQLRTWCYNNPRCDYHKADLPPVILDGCGLRATDRHSQGLLLQWGIGEALRFPGPLQLPANCTAVPGLEDLPRFHEAR